MIKNGMIVLRKAVPCGMKPKKIKPKANVEVKTVVQAPVVVPEVIPEPVEAVPETPEPVVEAVLEIPEPIKPEERVSVVLKEPELYSVLIDILEQNANTWLSNRQLADKVIRSRLISDLPKNLITVISEVLDNSGLVKTRQEQHKKLYLYEVL